MAHPLPSSIDETQKLLASGDYVADRSLATSLFLALAMRRPLFLEGEAGVGKTEDRKSTRLNSSHGYISYAVFCLKKKKNVLILRWDQIETVAVARVWWGRRMI